MNVRELLIFSYFLFHFVLLIMWIVYNVMFECLILSCLLCGPQEE
uniref:Uncharacterized protein n=1 Tax=Anguilla anguilla TaxID=7936 RepID=A0A0E9XZE2_ANGAN